MNRLKAVVHSSILEIFFLLFARFSTFNVESLFTARKRDSSLVHFNPFRLCGNSLEISKNSPLCIALTYWPGMSGVKASFANNFGDSCS